MSRRLLLIAYDFPPTQASSGVLRSLAFAKYLPAHDWSVTVLTVNQRAYGPIRDANMALIPANLRVVRAFALDAQKHCSIRGRYPSLLAVPDRWQSWIAGGYFAGRRLIGEIRPDVVLSTFPIASAHVLGMLLSRSAGLPWVADFRDPMTGVTSPESALARHSFAWVERQVFARASAVTVTTPGTRQMYDRLYPGKVPGGITVIANGFDENIGGSPKHTAVQAAGRKVRLLHSGLIYARQRNPKCFFEALAAMRQAGEITPDSLEIVLRASGNEEAYSEQIRRLGLEGIVVLAPTLDYVEALREMHEYDGLLVLQAEECSRQIPAKLYEYLHVGKPIMGITNADGDTGRFMLDMGIGSLAALDDSERIRRGLVEFIGSIRNGTAVLPERSRVMQLSRRARTAELAALLDRLVTE